MSIFWRLELGGDSYICGKFVDHSPEGICRTQCWTTSTIYLCSVLKLSHIFRPSKWVKYERFLHQKSAPMSRLSRPTPMLSLSCPRYYCSSNTRTGVTLQAERPLNCGSAGRYKRFFFFPKHPSQVLDLSSLLFLVCQGVFPVGKSVWGVQVATMVYLFVYNLACWLRTCPKY